MLPCSIKTFTSTNQSAIALKLLVFLLLQWGYKETRTVNLEYYMAELQSSSMQQMEETRDEQVVVLQSSPRQSHQNTPPAPSDDKDHEPDWNQNNSSAIGDHECAEQLQVCTCSSNSVTEDEQSMINSTLRESSLMKEPAEDAPVSHKKTIFDVDSPHEETNNSTLLDPESLPSGDSDSHENYTTSNLLESHNEPSYDNYSVHKPLRQLIHKTNKHFYSVDSTRIHHKAGLSKKQTALIPSLHPSSKKPTEATNMLQK